MKQALVVRKCKVKDLRLILESIHELLAMSHGDLEKWTVAHEIKFLSKEGEKC